jgi:hypothetical protein
MLGPAHVSRELDGRAVGPDTMRAMLTTKLNVMVTLKGSPKPSTSAFVRSFVMVSLLAFVAAGCKDEPTKPPGGTGGSSGAGGSAGRGGAGGSGGRGGGGGGAGGSGGSSGSGGMTGGAGGSAGDSGADVPSDGLSDGGDVALGDAGDAGDGSSDAGDAAPTDTTTDLMVTDGGAAAMTFFVTSTGTGALGGNLGGLIGADARCEAAAAAVGAGGKGWKAFLSITAAGGSAAVNAKDRIGAGPWRNFKSQVIAANVTALLSTPPAGNLMLDERGVVVPLDFHEVLTGTQADGTVYVDRTCNNWTSNATAVQAQVGIAREAVDAPDQRFSSHTVGCSMTALNNSGGDGRLYCFATTP